MDLQIKQHFKTRTGPVAKFARDPFEAAPTRRDAWRNSSPSLDRTRLRLHLEKIYRYADRWNLHPVKSYIQRILSGRRIYRNGLDAFSQLGLALSGLQHSHPEIGKYAKSYNWHRMNDRMMLDDMVSESVRKLVHGPYDHDTLLRFAGGDKNRDRLIPHILRQLKGQAIIDHPLTDVHIRDSLLRLKDGAVDRQVGRSQRGEWKEKGIAKAVKFSRLSETAITPIAPYVPSESADRGHIAIGHAGDYKYVLHRPVGAERIDITLTHKDGSVSHPTDSYSNRKALLAAHKHRGDFAIKVLDKLHSLYRS